MKYQTPWPEHETRIYRTPIFFPSHLHMYSIFSVLLPHSKKTDSCKQRDFPSVDIQIEFSIISPHFIGRRRRSAESRTEFCLPAARYYCWRLKTSESSCGYAWNLQMPPVSRVSWKRNSWHGTKRLTFLLLSQFHLLLPDGAVPERDWFVLPLRCSDWRLVFNLEDRAYGEVHAAQAGVTTFYSCGRRSS